MPDTAPSLWLLRHAMPDVRPDEPAHTWPLSEAGEVAAASLSPSCPDEAQLIASTEPKAWGTVEAYANRSCERDPRLGEVVRKEAFGGDFRALRRAYVEGVDHDEWEPRSSVAGRMQSAVEDAMARGGLPVLGTHGMALTVWLTAAGALTAAQAGPFWDALAFPQLIAVRLTPSGARLVGD